MKLVIVAVGHKMDAWVNAGFAEYAKRMPREARIELVEIKNGLCPLFAEATNAGSNVE